MLAGCALKSKVFVLNFEGKSEDSEWSNKSKKCTQLGCRFWAFFSALKLGGAVPIFWGLLWLSLMLYIYICCKVKKLVQILPFLQLNIGPLFVLLFCLRKSWFPPAERRTYFRKKTKREQKHFLKLKIGPIMSRNILGPVFNFNLDKFLTLEFSFFCFVFFVVFFGGGGLKPLFL